jgi:hypothetical protein
MNLLRVRRSCVVAMLLLGSSCATGYHEGGLFGGYRDEQLDSNTWRVSFSGNSSTARATVERYLMYRCAEVTVNAGFDYFVIAGGNTQRSEFTQSGPGTYMGQTSGYVTSSGDTAHGQTQTTGTYFPGATSTAVSYGSFAIIKAFKGNKPSDNPNAYNAKDVMKYIGPRIQR